MTTSFRFNSNERDMEAMECDNEKEFPAPENFAPSLIRIRSYDEEGRQETAGMSDDFQLSPINPLHTSLDAPQLDTQYPSAGALPTFRPAASWEENDPSVASHETSAKHAHFLPATTAEQPPPTARKLPRHSSDNVTLMSKTPLRPRSRSKKPGTKKTPVSAKRHRAPLHQRKSPRVMQMTPQRSQQLFPPPTARALTPRDGDRFTIARPMPNILLDDDTDATPHGISIRRKKKSIGTATTAASSHVLETTTETEDSMDTNDAPFRFTGFPASLPRVSTLRTPAVAASSAHGTIRKRMNFTDGGSEGVNRSRDDATHNTSVSSLPVDDGNMMYAESEEEHGSQDAPRSPMGTPVARTRLDFNSVISPTAGALRGGQTPLRNRAPDAPTTPREVKMHFQLNAANCSPIRDIPEEECEGSSGKSAAGFSRSNLSQETTSSDSSSKPGRMRPMPDMGAFDENASTPTRECRSGDDTVSTKSHPPSPRLLCPPTPVRTPAWAHGDASTSHSINRSGKMGRFNRQNSLIATKVLAICSPHVLNERNSLENSVLEDEGNHNNTSSLSDSAESTRGQGLSFEADTVIAPQDSMDNSGDWSPVAERKGRPSLGEASEHTVTLSTSFEVLSTLGSGTFADVYKVRAKSDGRLYAVKKNRRQFRGKRDREKALAEVRHMQRLQSAVSVSNGKSSYSLYLLFFFQAWQEEGHFFCQTELCCRDTCRELLDALRTEWRLSQSRYPSLRRLPCPAGVRAGSDADLFGRLTPESTIWKICHDICAGLSHIHSHGIVHFDIKPSNIFFMPHIRFGAMCKIGDFGMAGEIGTSEDGQEGDQKYMAPELLTSEVRNSSADVFSLGLTLFELASNLEFEVPSDGPRWHDLRNGSANLGLPSSRSSDLVELIRFMIQPDPQRRPTADGIISLPKVEASGQICDEFLRDYINDIEEHDRREELKANNSNGNQEQTPVILGRQRVWASPSFGTLPPMAPVFSSPDAV